MALDREERFLMRQRGAGKHKVQDTDFGFEILPPSSSVKSAQVQSTPARSVTQEVFSKDSTVRPSQRYKHKPEAEAQELLSDESSTQRYEYGSRARSVSIELGEASEEGSQKRRRLDNGAQLPLTIHGTTSLDNGKPQTPSSASLPAYTGSRSSRLSRVSQAEIPDSTDGQNAEDAGNVGSGTLHSSTQPYQASGSSHVRNLQGTPTTMAKEPNSNTASTAKKKRGRPTKADMAAMAEENAKLHEHFAPVTGIQRDRRNRRNTSNYNPIVEHDDDSQEELFKANEAKRNLDKKRRRQLQKRSGSVEPTTDSVTSQRDREDDASKQVSDESGKESDSSDPDDPTYRSDGFSRPAPAPHNDVEEVVSEPDELDESNIEREKKEESLSSRKASQGPVLQKGKKAAQSAGNSTKKNLTGPSKSSAKALKPERPKTGAAPSVSKTASRQPANTVPIVVHRLPLSKYTEEDEDSEDDLVKENFIRRGGVNAIDVLGQICRELVAKTVELLWQEQHNEQNNFKKGEWRRKRKAIEAFGTELDTRCFELTETLDNNHALSTRLKAAHKKKIELREQLLSIRKEREKIAIRTDEMQRRHATVLQAIEEQSELNSAMEGLELAVERGRTRQMETDHSPDDEPAGVEYLLKSIATEVSSASPEGSLLMRVREFNDFLEQAAEALESQF